MVENRVYTANRIRSGLSAAVIFLFFKTPPAAVPVKASTKEKFLQMDLVGTFVVVTAVVCYLLALQWGGVSKTWSDGSVIGTLVAFGVLSIIFVVIEYFLGERAILVGRLMKDRTISISMAFIFFLAGAFFLLLYYLPIYFQVVSGVSPSQSGVRNLPLILGTTIGTITSGMLITMFGHFVPALIASAVGTTVGAGLIFTLDIGSPSSQWIGYQALAGLSIGIGLQVPIISSPGISAPADLSSVTALILFFQTIGGAFFVTAGQSAFENVLINRLPFTAPGISTATIIAAGTTEIRTLFPAAAIAAILSLGSKWRNLKGVDISGAV